MEGTNAIEVRNIHKNFLIHQEKRTTVFDYLTSLVSPGKKNESLRVLDDVSFSVKRGETLGIVGLNGCGKTTLLRILSRIYSPDSGKGVSRGKIIPFLGLGAGLNPELTAKDNIVLYGVILGFTRDEITKKIRQIAEFAGVEDFLDTKLKNFSSGMSARLAFSVAVQVDPDILIVDEVLAVGDVRFREKSFDKFMEFKKRGKTIIYVSHNVRDIKDICDRAIFLHGGKILAEGDPAEVVDAYLRTVNG